jgi:SprT protein
MDNTQVALHKFAGLQQFLPDHTFEDVMEYIINYKVHLTITRPRTSILGNYRLPRNRFENHKITVNGNLNAYEFLITLLHELAHLLVFEKHGRSVKPHGQEWQEEYGEILVKFINRNIFPHDVEHLLIKTINKPAASCAGEKELIKALRKYNPNGENTLVVEDIAIGNFFKDKNEKVFRLEKKLRTRYVAIHVRTGKTYLFPSLYPVVKADNPKL